MSEHAVVSVIALLGFLILALSALRGCQINFAKGAWLVAAWIIIFAVVGLATSALIGS